MTGAVLIVTAVGSRDQADRIATVLVEERLAACVQLLPATSIYRWQGAVERAEEVVLHIKTAAERAEAVEDRIRDLHDYEVPEIVVLGIDGGSAGYLGWIASETSPL